MTGSKNTVCADPIHIDDSPSPSSSCNRSLSKFQWTQLSLLASCFALAFSSVTLVMSRAPIVVKMTGGSISMAPVSIAVFEIGKSFVVLPVAPLIRKHGRRMVFFGGTVFGLVSTALGALGVIYEMPWLILGSTFFAGTYTGIAYGYRYAAIEIVQEHREMAVTTCLSGGILAAIIGPLGASWSATWFTHYENLGIYTLNAIFVGINLLLLFFMSFPADENSGVDNNMISSKDQSGKNSQDKGSTVEAGLFPPAIDSNEYKDTSSDSDSTNTCAEHADTSTASTSAQTEKDANMEESGQAKSTVTVWQVVSNRAFFFAALLATMTWVCMSIPLSTVGLVMEHLDSPFSDGVVEATFIAHFLGMFLPGPGTGKFIQKFGFCAAGFLSVFLYIVATVLNIFSQDGEPYLWIAGQFFVGVAWNLGFTSATVMLSTSCPPDDREFASRAQSYSDFISFLGGGIITIAGGHILDSNTVAHILEGWQLLNYVQFLFIGIMLVVVIAAWKNKEGSAKSALGKFDIQSSIDTRDALADDN